MNTSEFLSHANWLAIAVAAIAYFALGGLWYSVLFGKAWIKVTGIDMNRPGAKKGVGGVMVFTFVMLFVTCTGLALIVHRTMPIDGVLSGLKLGALTGICFSAIGIGMSYLYQGKPKALTLIDGGYHVLGNIIAAVILCIW
ncbi:MAG TPA: DUF1761 domain-containing protein [Chitinophagaceae bacterium]|jgi:hypothetical protein|nr:DUF1761 domain-containing protein [Chitinophagaceae bacterium]